MDLKEKIRGALRLGSGMEFQAAGLMYEKARFPYLFSLLRGTVSDETMYSVCGMQRERRLRDSEKMRHVGRSG